MPVVAAGLSIAKEPGNQVSAQKKSEFGATARKGTSWSSSGAKEMVWLLQGVMKWWRDPAKRPKAAGHKAENENWRC